MQNFYIAKRTLGILVVIGWIVIALAALVGASSLRESNLLASFLVFGPMAMSGLILIVGSQMGLAQIATAENTREMLQIMRKRAQLAPQETPATKTGTGPNSFNAVKENGVGSAIKTYKGYLIMKTQDGVEVDGEPFPNLSAAEKWINQNPK
jgi:hypothetical protein